MSFFAVALLISFALLSYLDLDILIIINLARMQKVIPPGLNYGDIKPEAIENQIRIVKFTPIATITQAQANDIVRFHL